MALEVDWRKNRCCPFPRESGYMNLELDPTDQQWEVYQFVAWADSVSSTDEDG